MKKFKALYFKDLEIKKVLAACVLGIFVGIMFINAPIMFMYLGGVVLCAWSIVVLIG